MSSKRKNPLQNLNDFLRQEASSFVTPKNLKGSSPVHDQDFESLINTEKQVIPPKASEIRMEYVVELIQKLANKNNLSVKQQLLEILKHILEENGLESSKDKMLINTILYIQNEDDWQVKVREYWEKYST